MAYSYSKYDSFNHHVGVSAINITAQLLLGLFCLQGLKLSLLLVRCLKGFCSAVCINREASAWATAKGVRPDISPLGFKKN
jgi:hypothetical protein